MRQSARTAADAGFRRDAAGAAATATGIGPGWQTSAAARQSSLYRKQEAELGREAPPRELPPRNRPSTMEESPSDFESTGRTQPAPRWNKEGLPQTETGSRSASGNRASRGARRYRPRCPPRVAA